MGKQKQLKFIWEHEPPGKLGKWRYGTQQGKLGAVWYANGQWWAAPNGHEQFQGGFVSSDQAITYVQENAQGLPELPASPSLPAEPTLEEMLGGKDSQTYSRYWKTMKCWPSDKNYAPKQTAKAWLKACEKTDAKTIYFAAQNYRDLFLPPKRPTDECRFMKNPLTWLQEEAWLATKEDE